MPSTLRIKVGSSRLVLTTATSGGGGGGVTTQVLPTSVGVAAAKATANTAQWQTFKSTVDALLPTVVASGYLGHDLGYLADFALAYRCLKSTNPSLASDYADKAVGLLKSGLYEFRWASPELTSGRQFLARGDGLTQTFTLPGIPLTGTLAVALATVEHRAIVRSATYDQDVFDDIYAEVPRVIIKVANTSDGTPAYTLGADYTHGELSAADLIDWTGAGSKPANGATYYVTSATVVGATPTSAYTVLGDQLTFTSAPAANQAIFVQLVYHIPGGLKYQQTLYNSRPFYGTLFYESGYVSRNLQYLAMAYDWLYDHSRFDTTFKAQVAALLVKWFDAITTETYVVAGRVYSLNYNNTAHSNYGLGHYAYKVMTAAALANRDANANRLQSNVLAWRTSYMLPALVAPTDGTCTLCDGHYNEGPIYGSYAESDGLRSAQALVELGWIDGVAEKAWAADIIRSFLHQQPARAYVYSGGDGTTNPQPIIDKNHWGVYGAITSDTQTRGYVNWQLLTGSGVFSIHYETDDLMFHDPDGTPIDPTLSEPLARFHRGTGLLVSRAAWDYASTWMAAIGPKAVARGHEVGTYGAISLYRGPDILLADGRAIGDYIGGPQNSYFSNDLVCDDAGDGLTSYRWAPGYWEGDPGAITGSGLTSDYAYLTYNYKTVYSIMTSPGNSGQMVELEREVFHLRPDYVVVFDRAETTQSYHPKQLRYYLQNYNTVATAGTFTLTHSSNTTSNLAFNASAATVQTALEALTSIGAGNVTVTVGNEVGNPSKDFSYNDNPIGHYYVVFGGALAGTTQPLLTGDGSGLTTLGGGAGRVRIQDMHPSTSSGKRLTQVVFLGETITSDAFTVASGSSKLFGKVFAPVTLTTSQETTCVTSFPGQVDRVLVQNTTPAASVRYVTALQTAPSATSAMDTASFLLGTGSQLFGLILGQTVTLARYPRTGFSLPDTYDYTAPGGLVTHRITGLTPGASYQLSGDVSDTVIASAAGIATFTTTGTGAQTVTIGPVTVPSAPSSLTATAVSSSQIDLAWTDNSTNETGFILERSLNGTTGWTQISTPIANAVSDSNINLSPSTIYYYRIKATNTAGDSAYSNTANTTTIASSPPSAPSSLTATAVSSSQINLTWTDNSTNEDGFVLERSPNGTSGWAQISTPAVNATSVSSTGLSPSTIYYYRIKATNSAGDSAYSNTANATTQSGPVTTFNYSRIDPGVSTLLDDWYTAEGTRQGTSPPPSWWLWQTTACDWANSGYPGFILGQHAAPGVKFFKNLFPTNGGTIAFSDVTTSELGANPWDIGEIPGEGVAYDADGDGVPDFAPIGIGNLWRIISGTLTNTGVAITGGSNYLSDIGDFNADGKLDLRDTSWPSHSTITSFNDVIIRTRSWNGSSYTVTTGSFTFPAGVPQAVIDDCLSRLQDPSLNDNGVLHLHSLDLDANGTVDLVIAGTFAYGSSHNFAYYLQNDGAGNYTDFTANWGLPRDGTFLPLVSAQFGIPRLLKADQHLHTAIDGAGTMCLFIGNHATNAGFWKWTGSGYTHQTGSIITTTLQAAQILSESYMPQMYALDLTNAGRLDLIYHSPRDGVIVLFTNDGSGTFSRVSGPQSGTGGFYAWDPYGFAVADLDGDGLLDIILGNTDPATGTFSAVPHNKLSVLHNTSTNPGNYLKVKLRKATGSNPFGAGGNVEVYPAGSSTLLRRWAANPSGIPVHFGMGGHSTIDLKVNWPDGTTSTSNGVTTNQTVTVTS